MHTCGRLAVSVCCAIWIAAAPAFAQDAAEKTAEGLIKAGKHAEALAALSAVRGAGVSAARIDLLRSTALRALGRLDESKAAAERAQRAAKTAAAPAVETRALLLLAQLATDRGDNKAAAVYLAPALAAARLSSDPILPITVLEALGRSARALGDNQGALAHQGAAITAAEAANQVDLVVRARGARSTTLLGLGRFDEALADAQSAYDRVKGDAPARLKASATFALAQVHAHLWNLERAAVLWDETLEHYKAAGLQIGVALSTKQRMETWYALAEFDRAAADGAEALRLFERTGSAGTTPELFARLALIEARRGNAAAARAFAARAAGQPLTGPRVRFVENDLGLTSLFLGDVADAAARFTRVFDQSIALGDLEYAWRAQHMRGRAWLQMGRIDDAERDLRQAVATLERMRRTLPEAGLRASFMSDRREVYATLADALVRRSGEPGDAQAVAALAAAEQSRARSLVEQLAEADLRASDPALERIRREEQAVSTRLTGLQQRILALPETARAPAIAELAQAEADYDALVIRLRRDHGAYRTLVNPPALDRQTLQAISMPGEVILSYLFTFDGGLAWAARDGRLMTFRIPSRARIESQVRLLKALVTAGDVEGVRAIGASLYAALMNPAEAMLANARRVTIIPDGPVHRLPFALLRKSRDRGPWLAQSAPMTLAPSAAVLGRLRARERAPATGALAAFAADGTGSTRAGGLVESVPRATLEHANREVAEIARIVGDTGEVRVETHTAESLLKAAGADRFRVLHFAAHAAIDETAPRRSAILLGATSADDGLLQLNEIAALRLNARLVVAATCRSQLGRAVGGEGLMSLSRAFLQAGADAVVAALWDVDDAQTRRFMRFFYTGLREGLPADEAIGRAQASMLRLGGASALPQNWAGFVLTGAGATAVFAPPVPGSSRLRWVLGAVAAVIVLSLAFTQRRRRTAAIAP